jgi:hypothetical protein
MLRNTVNPIQRIISEAFEEMFGSGYDWTISEFGVKAMTVVKPLPNE